jgi:hypothetical protein
MLGGHKVWHLREHLWAKLDLYVDAASFRLRRLVLWDRPGPAIRWQIRFDYSRFKAPLQINAPNGRSG